MLTKSNGTKLTDKEFENLIINQIDFAGLMSDASVSFLMDLEEIIRILALNGVIYAGPHDILSRLESRIRHDIAKEDKYELVRLMVEHLIKDGRNKAKINIQLKML